MVDFKERMKIGLTLFFLSMLLGLATIVANFLITGLLDYNFMIILTIVGLTFLFLATVVIPIIERLGLL